MEIDKKTGLIRNIVTYASPHSDERSTPAIDLIVVHGISLPKGEFGLDYIHQLFMGNLQVDAHPTFASIAHLKVSAHVVIRRDGSVTQYVPFTQRAWHAGISEFQGRQHCNDFSIGIELEGTDEVPYEERQYQQLAKLVHQLQRCYDIPATHIVGHDEIAPGRKTDPGPAFSWDYFHQLKGKL